MGLCGAFDHRPLHGEDEQLSQISLRSQISNEKSEGNARMHIQHISLHKLVMIYILFISS